MRVIIYPEQQIQRINHLVNELERYQSMDSEKLNKRPKEKSWSALETMKHISIGHSIYVDKIEKTFSISQGEMARVDSLKASTIPSYLIKRFPPKDGKVRLKMKTSSKFIPVFENGEGSRDEIVQELKNCLDELKNWVEQYRTSSISLIKFNSAIGPIVRFNIPEACEFILCHAERHFLQIENALK